MLRHRPYRTSLAGDPADKSRSFMRHNNHTMSFKVFVLRVSVSLCLKLSFQTIPDFKVPSPAALFPIPRSLRGAALYTALFFVARSGAPAAPGQRYLQQF